MTTTTGYEIMKECFDKLKDAPPLERKPTLEEYGNRFDQREQEAFDTGNGVGYMRGIDKSIKIATRNNNLPNAVTEMTAEYGYAKAAVQNVHSETKADRT